MNSHRQFKVNVLLGFFACGLATTGLIPSMGNAQSGIVSASVARDLVTSSVDASQRRTLADHRAPWAITGNDRGAVPNDLPMSHLTLVLNRTGEREQAFQQLLKDQQDSKSPNYHHWLTANEIGARYGASQHDIDAVSAWLTSQGLHVDGVSNSRVLVTFSGTIGTVTTAFATPIHYFQIADDSRIANVGDPQVPAALAGIISAVNGLHTVRYKPMHKADARQGTLGPVRPADTYCPQGSGSCTYAVFPADFAKIYDLTNVPSNITGKGQTIAIVGKARVYAADIQNYQELSGVSFTIPSDSAGTIIVPTSEGGVDPGPPASTCTNSGTTNTCSNPSDAVNNQSEATIDVERAGSVASGATLKLIVSADSGSGSNAVDGLNYALQYAVDDDPTPANILSISFNSCEASNSASTATFLDQEFSQAAAQGMSIFVASGDSGAADCADANQPPTAGQSRSIGIFCASGSVTCVGGTEFADSTNPSAYWASSDQGNYFLSALGYIPEGAWNEPMDASNNLQISSTGGGVSVYLPTPSWQTGPGVPGTQGRYVPDISFAAAAHDAYFACMAAMGGDCNISSDGSFNYIGAAGTSAGTPSMAAITALLNQKTGAAQGNLNPRLYALAATANSSVFHDVTVASSGVSNCSVAIPSMCNNSTPGPNGLSGGVQGYQVGTGYDLATGWGSIDAANLLTQWGGGDNSGSTSVNLNQFGLTGTWENTNTGGQGFLFNFYPDTPSAGTATIAVGWYTYDAGSTGGQRWYALQGTATSSDASAALTIYQATGGNFNAPPVVSSAPVGTATVSFTDCSHGTLGFQFSDGRSGSIPLTRVATNVICSSSGGGNAFGSNYFLSGAWYNPSTSGQGLYLEVNPLNTLFFGAWYTYTPNGAQTGGGASQRWYVIQDSAFVPGTVSKNGLTIYETSGGVFNSGHVTPTPVGTTNIAFQNCNALTISYSFTAGTNAGQQGSVDLVRLGPTPSGCNL